MQEERRPRAQFARVAHDIRRRIAAGTYPVGSRLPPIAALADEFDSSHMTIKQAIGQLVEEGLVASRRGVPAEVIAAPVSDEPLSVADRLARVEGIVSSLESRVAAIEDHDTHPRRGGRSSP